MGASYYIVLPPGPKEEMVYAKYCMNLKIIVKSLRKNRCREWIPQNTYSFTEILN